MESIKRNLLIFTVLNVLLYLFIFLFNSSVPFHKTNYFYNAHHYNADPRIQGKKFNLFYALAQYDSQWYLKIAGSGYPKNPKIADLQNKKMDGLAYSFLPLYPILISGTNVFFDNIELSAYIVSNIFLLLSFISLYYIISKLFSKEIAVKSLFLLFFWPFAIFYRSYYPVGVFLFFLAWFAYFVARGRLLAASIFLGLMNITWGMGILLNFYLFYKVGVALLEKKISVVKGIIILALALLPFIVWIVFNYSQTGNPLYFYRMRQVWFESPSPIHTLFYNIITILSFFYLPLHSFHASRIDVLVIVSIVILLIASRKRLPADLWVISLAIGLTPLLIQDTISYSRLQIVSFPLFVYLATILKRTWHYSTVTVFTVSLFVLSLYFINWYWIG